MIYEYARVSTESQNLQRQIKNLSTAYPNSKMYCDKYSGRSLHRPEWDKLLARVRSGDTIVFDSVSRMSRNADDGVQQYFDFFDRGINLIFLKEPLINTDTYRQALDNANDISRTGNIIADKYIDTTKEVLKIIASQQIRLAFEQSEKEVADLRQRTKEGIAVAKANGKLCGGAGHKNPYLITKKSVDKKLDMLSLSADFEGNLPDKKCIELLHIARNSYYKYKAELQIMLSEKSIEDVKKELLFLQKSR